LHQKKPFIRIIYIYMTQDYQNLFNLMTTPDPSDKLFIRIISQIRQKQKNLIIKKRLISIISGLSLIGSLIAFIPILNLIQIRLAESGFFKFFSLIFSDFKIVASYWQNYILSLLESLPILNLLALLIVILIFLKSLQFIIVNFKLIIPHKTATNH
jgi:hypothetical protein